VNRYISARIRRLDWGSIKSANKERVMGNHNKILEHLALNQAIKCQLDKIIVQANKTVMLERGQWYGGKPDS